MYVCVCVCVCWGGGGGGGGHEYELTIVFEEANLCWPKRGIQMVAEACSRDSY